MFVNRTDLWANHRSYGAGVPYERGNPASCGGLRWGNGLVGEHVFDLGGQSLLRLQLLPHFIRVHLLRG